MGLESCMRIASIPMPEASHSTTNDLLKSGSANTGPVVIARLSLLNAKSADSDHTQESFLSKWVKGPTMSIPLDKLPVIAG